MPCGPCPQQAFNDWKLAISQVRAVWWLLSALLCIIIEDWSGVLKMVMPDMCRIFPRALSFNPYSHHGDCCTAQLQGVPCSQNATQWCPLALCSMTVWATTEDGRQRKA